jgi:hypothetical protein
MATGGPVRPVLQSTAEPSIDDIEDPYTRFIVDVCARALAMSRIEEADTRERAIGKLHTEISELRGKVDLLVGLLGAQHKSAEVVDLPALPLRDRRAVA